MSTRGFQINHDEVTTPPRASSSVLLLRDGAGGLELLMQRRSDESDVLGGAYVFPGGKVDRDDAEDDMLARIDSSPAALHAALCDAALDERAAAAYFVAACRETFEEAGVLLAARRDGTPLGGAGALDAMALSRQGLAFVEVLEHLDLTLSVSALLPWSRWVTPRIPSVQRKRFDVHFFLLRAPADQVAKHDNRETTDSLWVAPRAALELYGRREIMLAPPQLMSLAELARHETTEQAMLPGAVQWPRRIDPRPFEHEGTRAVAYPGDVLHPDPVRAMPGPTRLIFRDGRFEPFSGTGEFGLP